MKLTVPTTVGNLDTRTSQAKAAARPARVSAFGPEVPRHFFWLSDILALVAAFHLAYLTAARVKALAPRC